MQCDVNVKEQHVKNANLKHKLQATFTPCIDLKNLDRTC